MCDACNALNVSRRRFLEGMALAGTGVFAAAAPQGVALALDGSAGLTDEVKDASSLTEAANVVWYDKLDFEDRSEYENATRNLIAAPRRTRDMRRRGPCHLESKGLHVRGGG